MILSPYPLARSARVVSRAPSRQGDLRQWAGRAVEKVRAAWSSGQLRFLPYYGDQTGETAQMRKSYREMIREPVLKAAWQKKSYSVAQLDIQAHPEDDADPRQRECAEFVRWALGKVHGGTAHVAWSILSGGLLDGWSLCEKVWSPEPVPYGKWQGKRRYQSIKSKDTEHLRLKTDDFLNVVGFCAQGVAGGVEYGPDDLHDFVLWSHMPLFADTAGRSDFRAAYRSYWRKDTVMKLGALHLEKFVGPYLRGTYSTNDQKAALEAALEAAAARTWVSVPTGAMVDAISLSTGATNEYDAAIERDNREMLLATVGSYLQILEGQVGAERGNTRVHQETGELIDWMLSQEIATLYTEQVSPYLTQENYAGLPPPAVTLGAINLDELEARARLDAQLQQIGVRLSKAAANKYYGVTEPADEADVLQPLQAQQPPGGQPGGGFPFSEAFCAPGTPQAKPGPCPEGGKGDAPAAPPKKQPVPRKELHDRGEQIAGHQNQNMRALMSKMKSGDYTPDDAVADAQIYTDAAKGANHRAFAGRLADLQNYVRDTYGPAAVASPEWSGVRDAFRAARDKTAERLDSMKAEVEAAARHGVTRGRVDNLINEHNDLVHEYHQAVQDISDKIEAFYASHKPASAKKSESFDDARGLPPAPGKDADPARFAEETAAAWNAREAEGGTVPDAEIDAAAARLEGTGRLIYWDEAAEEWATSDTASFDFAGYAGA